MRRSDMIYLQSGGIIYVIHYYTAIPGLWGQISFHSLYTMLMRWGLKKGMATWQESSNHMQKADDELLWFNMSTLGIPRTYHIYTLKTVSFLLNSSYLHQPMRVQELKIYTPWNWQQTPLKIGRLNPQKRAFHLPVDPVASLFRF